MSWGQEIFRKKYRETMESINTIYENYYDLDRQYQEEMKEKMEEIDKQAKVIQWYEKENRHNQEIIIKDTKEIERLNNKVEELTTLYTTEINVKEDYKTIIKEVREYIAHYVDNEYRNGRDDELYLELNEKELKELLEILDKENNV